MRTSDNIEALAKALSSAQGEITNPAKDQTNPHFRSRYADLAGGLVTIRPTLAKHGLSVVQMTNLDGDMVTLHTRLLHSSGQWVESTYPVCRTTDHQKMGSALTYSRRYTLFALVGVAADDDDDDGNTAATGRGRVPVNGGGAVVQDKASPATGRVSSASIKRDRPDLWPALERKVRDCPTIDDLTAIWEETQEESDRWPRSWQDARWELFETRTEELKSTAQAAE
jgi:hypothetical protein